MRSSTTNTEAKRAHRWDEDPFEAIRSSGGSDGGHGILSAFHSFLIVDKLFLFACATQKENWIPSNEPKNNYYDFDDK